MLESKTATIGEHTYKVTQIPFKKGKRLLVRLFKTFGPVLAKAIGTLPEMDVKELANVSVVKLLPSVSSGLMALTQSLSEEDLDLVTDAMAEYTELDKGDDKWVPLKSEMAFHFSGKYGEYLKWLGFALKVNYASFLAEPGALAGMLQAAIHRASQSPKESTGAPTE